MAFSKQQMKELLSVYELTFEYEQDEEGRYAGSIEQIEDIVADGETLEELRSELARDLVEYALDYENNYSHTTSILSCTSWNRSLEMIIGMPPSTRMTSSESFLRWLLRLPSASLLTDRLKMYVPVYFSLRRMSCKVFYAMGRP